MKKFFAVLLALALVAGAVSAQVTLKGLMRTGITMFIPDGDENYPVWGVWDANDGYAWRAELDATYQNEPGTVGVALKLRGNVPAGITNAAMNGDLATYSSDDFKKNILTLSGGGPSLYFELARAWFKLPGPKITFWGGKMDEGGHSTGLGIDSSLDVSVGRGIYTRFETIDNLRIGLGIYPNLGKNAALITSSSDGQGLAWSRYTLGLFYTLPGMAEIVFDVAKEPTEKELISGKSRLTALDKALTRVDIAAGVNVLALKDSVGFSKLGVDFRIEDLDADWKVFSIGERVTFAPASNPLEAGLRFAQYAVLGDYADKEENKDTYTTGLIFTGYVQYKLREGTIVPKLELGYAYGRDLYTARPDFFRAGAWDVFDGQRGVKTYLKDNAALAVIPQVAFNFGGSTNSQIVVGGGLYADLPSYEDAEKTYNGAIFANYRISF